MAGQEDSNGCINYEGGLQGSWGQGPGARSSGFDAQPWPPTLLSSICEAHHDQLSLQRDPRARLPPQPLLRARGTLRVTGAAFAFRSWELNGDVSSVQWGTRSSVPLWAALACTAPVRDPQ